MGAQDLAAEAAASSEYLAACAENERRFDIWNDVQMRDCIGGRLTKPVQTLLISYQQLKLRGEMSDADKANFLDSLRGELKDLLVAVKEEFRNL